MKPCSFVTGCAVVTFEKWNNTEISVGADLVEGDPEYFVLLCVKDIAGCQHTRTRGATGMVLMERFSRACRLIFDRVIVPGLSQDPDRQ